MIIKTFCLNKESGGKGKFVGGDGLVREYMFRKELSLNVLTERRVFAPYGMEEGESGKKGRNILTTKDGQKINLGSKSTVDVKPFVKKNFFFDILIQNEHKLFI